MVEIVKGKQVTVQFDGTLCIHSRNCVLSHPEVFVPNVQGDWIFPDNASVEAVMRIALNCPSGAIRAVSADEMMTSEIPPIVNTVHIRENGPLAIEGDLMVRGEPLGRARATLCRCGHSGNKPFCDGAHVEAGFAATGEPPIKEAKPLDERDGPIDIQPLHNGPLQVIGNLEIVSGTGRTIDKIRKAFLCRCGVSQDKPYCDGSHKKVNFIAE